MTRLESAIRRLTAQRLLLDWAAREIADKPGLILELGLGNGRTYDHLRDRLPGRDIYVFERSPAAHPDSTPPASHLLVGDIFETLPGFIARMGERSSILVHADIGSGDQAENSRLAARLSPFLARLLAPSALVLADRALNLPEAQDITKETGVSEGRYFVYRQAA